MSARILLAGGGTAGHIEPALAVADELKKLRPETSCEFLGTDGALEALLVPKRGFRLHTIKKVVLPRKISFSILKFPLDLAISISQATKALSGVDLLIGFGGYVSAPAYLAAAIKRIPVIIHEANAKPGWANRLGRHFAKLTAVNFESVRRDWPGSVLTGMPIRTALSAVNSLTDRVGFKELNCKSWGLNPNKPIVAIFGGSQGSLHINKVLQESLSELSEIQILHAVGINNELPKARPNYLPMHYFHDMAAVYGSADLLITRSGAVTCAELESLGKFAILIPLPHGNGEQVDNAQALVKDGAAVMVMNSEFDRDWLLANINLALEKASTFQPRKLGVNSGAAKRIAELALLELDKTKSHKGKDK